MLYIIVGEDRWSRQKYIQKLQKQLSLPVREYDSDSRVLTEDLLAGDLFGGATLFLLSGLLPQFIAHVDALKASQNHIVLMEEKVDKRTSEIKKLLKDSGITRVECAAPEAAGLPAWIEAKAKDLGTTIDRSATAELIARVGAVAVSSFSSALAPHILAQLDLEMEKLATYTNGKPIGKAVVELLTPNEQEVVAFDIINALAAKQPKKLFPLLEDFFSRSDAGQEKQKAILLAALLADQCRSLLVTLGLKGSHMSEPEALSRTGWKPGRWYVLTKLSEGFTQAELMSLLDKLEHLDRELKSSNTSPQVLLDLILAPHT